MTRSNRSFGYAEVAALLGCVVALLLAPSNPAAIAQDSAGRDVDPTPAEIEATELLRLIDALGADEFAVRENAGARLLEVGRDAIPELERIARSTSDAEIRLRASEIVKQLQRSNLSAQLQEFLAGRSNDFDGWEPFRLHFGDTVILRELFVELMTDHPQLTVALDGTARDLYVATELVVKQVQKKMFDDLENPSVADTFALVICLMDDDVLITGVYEKVLMSVLRRDSATKIRNDAQLKRHFVGLLERWLLRCTIENREEVLNLAMDWEISTALAMAVQTLAEATDAETIAVALMVIAQNGGKEQVDAVTPLLEDDRKVGPGSWAEGSRIQTQVGDVAIATIARIHGVPLSQFGFRDVQRHEKYPFVVSELGFPVAKPAARRDAIAKMRRLIASPPKPAGS